VVCGIETKRHSGWFLVTENRWLDRVRVLCWHPVLARQTNMHSACGEQHLRMLLTHWLTYANLEFLATGCSRFPGGGKRGHDSFRTSAGTVVGELAVHREAMSRVWTGSPESLACILDALIGGIETRSRSSMMPLVDRSSGFTARIAMQ
jgi:hypothetical protein